MTADRPVAARPTGPGQFVRQTNLFAAHTVLSLEVDEATQGESDIEQQALAAWTATAKGPVHVNVPFEEPLYETVEATLTSASVPVIRAEEMPVPEELLDALSCHDPRVLVHIGSLGEGQLDADGVRALRNGLRCWLMLLLAHNPMPRAVPCVGCVGGTKRALHPSPRRPL